MADEDAIDFTQLTSPEPIANDPAPIQDDPLPADPVTPDPAPVDPPAVVQPTQPAPGHVPLSAVLDEREKRQAAERELAKYREQQQQPKPPNVTDDPQGYQAAIEARQAKFELDTRMQMSGRFASSHYGQDKVSAAMEWGKEQNSGDPYFGSKFTSQQDPYGWLVEQHRQAQTLGMLGGKSFDDAARDWAVSQGFIKPDDATQQQPVATQVAASPAAPQRPTPPRSIASATPAGAQQAPVTLRDEEIVEGLWK